MSANGKGGAMRISYLFILTVLFSIISPCDIVYFKSGGLLHGRIIKETTDRVEFDLVGGARYSCLMEWVDRIKREPQLAYYIKNGDYYFSKGQEKRAVVQYKAALKLVPNYATAIERLELVEYNQLLRKTEESIAAAEAMIKDERYKKALESYEEALKVSPSDQLSQEILDGMTLIYSRVAYVYYDHCYYEDAEKNLSMARSINTSRDSLSPKCAEIYFILGRISQDKNDLYAAKRHLEYALQLDPYHKGARNQLSEVIHALRKSGS
jgi:tetratricopeptide (TPR) repeat protein